MRRTSQLCKWIIGFFIMAAGNPSSATESNGLKVTGVEPNAAITTPGSRVIVYGTGFSPETVVYFGGLEAREMKFMSSSTLAVVTPYMRPGPYQLQLKSGETIVRSEVTFTDLPSAVDAEIDRAVALAEQKQTSGAILLLTNIARTSGDFQVRAFAHYQAGHVYLAQGDWWRWAGEVGGIFEPEAGKAVQTSWRYGLAYAQSVYLLPVDSDPDTALRLADWTVKFDVTNNPEPRFFRSLVNARPGNLTKAKADCDFILKLEPNNASFRALAAYIDVLSNDKTRLRSISGEPTTDARALSLLGQAAYLSGDLTGAQLWWTQEEKAYPTGASLAYWAGKKHLARGQQRVGEALLAECVAMAPDSKEAKEASELLAKTQSPRD